MLDISPFSLDMAMRSDIVIEESGCMPATHESFEQFKRASCINYLIFCEYFIAVDASDFSGNLSQANAKNRLACFSQAGDKN